MKRALIFLFTIFSLLSITAFGKIILRTNTDSPSVDNPFYIQATFINEDGKDYKIVGIENFKILSRGTSRSLSYINGKKSSERNETYTLLPLSKGRITLQVITGDSKSNILKLNVSGTIVKNLSSTVSFVDNLHKNNTYYFGQKIPYIEKFMTTEPLENLSYVEIPQLNSFSVKDLSPQKMPYEYFTAKNGKKGITYTTYMGIIMPNSSGKQKIIMGKMGYQLANSYARTRYIGGETKNINILPLPRNAPDNFQNVVGTPEIKFSYNKSKVEYGDSVLLNVTIYGDANLDNLDKIINNSLPDFNIFETLKSSDSTISQGKYYAKKEFEIAFIPRQNGDITIPEIKIPYFNTKTRKYNYLNVPSHKLKVIGKVAPQVSTLTSTPASTVHISTIAGATKPNKKVMDVLYMLIAVVIFEGVVIAYIVIKRRKKDKYDLISLKSAKTTQEFYERYCNFMKNNFKFSPKVHLDDKLLALGFSKNFVKLNHEIEEAYYKNEKLNISKIVKEMKNELKNR